LTNIVNQAHSKFRLALPTPATHNTFDEWKKACHIYIQNLPPDPLSALSTAIHKGVQEFKRMPAVLKIGDKNLGLIAMYKKTYNQLLMSHLRTSTYRSVPTFPHQDLCQQARSLVLPAYHLDPHRQIHLLDQIYKNDTPCPFYVIPKIHKPKLWSRTISAQHSYTLAPLSIMLAQILQKEADIHTNITRDSRTFLRQMYKAKIPPNSILLTYDVEVLYPSINISDAISILHTNIPVMRAHGSFWTRVLALIMHNNYICAYGQIFKQLSGTATGTQVAPPFANLYLHYRYRLLFQQSGILFESRYIDDGFVIVSNPELAATLPMQLNSLTNLTFTYTISRTHAVYLNVFIYRGKQFLATHISDTRTFFKPTNQLLYLPAQSNHPKTTKMGIIKGEAIRTLRNSSSYETWLDSMNWIFKGLLARGYRPADIQKQFATIRFAARENYIEHGSCREKQPPTSFILCQYYPRTAVHWRLFDIFLQFAPNVHSDFTAKTNARQASFFTIWPPSLVYHNYSKLSRQVVAAKQSSL
jgi:hypothetical protein